MKTTLRITSLLLIASMGIVSACKKEDNNTNNTTTPKTLTKSLLYGKYWQTKGNTVGHYFQSNGDYGQIKIGTWKWLNNSDSMEIDDGAGKLIWYFEYNTEHEFSAKPSKNSTYMLFKDQSW